MLAPQYWITNRAVDELEGDELTKFEKAYQDFTDIFEEEGNFSPRSLYCYVPHRYHEEGLEDWKLQLYTDCVALLGS